MELTQSKFFFDTPLYSEITLPGEKRQILSELFTPYKKSFEGFNPLEKVESTFQVSSFTYSNIESFIRDGGIGKIQITCKRYDSEFYYFIVWAPSNDFLIKIGQWPSVADFHLSELKQYKKVISGDKLKEFSKAIGLAANGVGIGSFVYLRRIFEHLIFEAFAAAKAEGVIANVDFFSRRMEEKIELLKNYLPSFLVENKGMYSILSLGIHELSEDSCLQHFDALRVGIEIILDEKLEELKKKEKMEEAKKKIESIKGAIKK